MSRLAKYLRPRDVARVPYGVRFKGPEAPAREVSLRAPRLDAGVTFV